MALFEQGIKEGFIPSVASYSRRVWYLALIYIGLFSISTASIFAIVLRGKFLVTLAQRSNVETLTLAFLLLFYTYIASLSWPGVFGSLKLIYCHLIYWGSDRKTKLEARKTALAIAAHNGQTSQTGAALNVIIAHEKSPAKPLTIKVEDNHGSLGTVVFDGARLIHFDTLGDGSNSMLVFIVEQMRKLLQARGSKTTLQILEWDKIDDEAYEKYLSFVDFTRNLEKHLGSAHHCPTLWPTIKISDDDITHLERKLSELCPTLRNEALLPDWEYGGEHKLPIIPEPLGILSLSRTEKRVDPIASMGITLAILMVLFLVVLVFVVYPPWVPGT